jgi:hypothetical protein
MTLTDEELTLYAMREAHLILAAYIEPGAQDAEKTIQELLKFWTGQMSSKPLSGL